MSAAFLYIVTGFTIEKVIPLMPVAVAEINISNAVNE